MGLASCMLQENRRKKQNSIFNQHQNDTCKTLIHGGAKEEQVLNLSSIRYWGLLLLSCLCTNVTREHRTMKYNAMHFTTCLPIGIHLNRLKCIHLSCVRGGGVLLVGCFYGITGAKEGEANGVIHTHTFA